MIAGKKYIATAHRNASMVNIARLPCLLRIDCTFCSVSREYPAQLADVPALASRQ